MTDGDHVGEALSSLVRTAAIIEFSAHDNSSFRSYLDADAARAAGEGGPEWRETMLMLDSWGCVVETVRRI